MNMVRRRLILGILVVALPLAACGQESVDAEVEEPAAVEEISGSELSRLTLSTSAVERLGIETAAVGEEGSGSAARTTVPYAAVLYDADGQTWAYVSPEENVFVRHAIVVDRIDGETALLVEGPPVGTAVVTIGAAELYGTETGVGGGH
jgi:hypothetical protein